MTYRIFYTDAPSSPTRERRVPERTEYYTSLQAALARARDLLERVDCHMVLISGDARQPIGSDRMARI